MSKHTYVLVLKRTKASFGKKCIFAFFFLKDHPANEMAKHTCVRDFNYKTPEIDKNQTIYLIRIHYKITNHII